MKMRCRAFYQRTLVGKNQGKETEGLPEKNYWLKDTKEDFNEMHLKYVFVHFLVNNLYFPGCKNIRCNL